MTDSNNGSAAVRAFRKAYCWWAGCVAHPQDPAPPDYASCMRCDGCVTYSDAVGDTRRNRFKDAARYWLWRKWWPEKCGSCWQRFSCDEKVDHIPF